MWTPSAWSGFRCSSVSSTRTRSIRSRLSRSGSFAIAGRSIRKGIVSPSTVGLERRLELGDLLGLLARELAEVALGGEAPELADAPVAVRRLAERLRLLELRQLGVALVDRRELELLLEARVVEVELLVELGDEAVGPLAEAVEVGRRERGGCAGQGRRRITRCGRST